MYGASADFTFYIKGSETCYHSVSYHYLCPCFSIHQTVSVHNPSFPPLLSHYCCDCNPGYAVLVEKAGHFLEKAGHFRKMPGFFSIGQVLVVWRKSRAFSENARLFPKLPGFLIIRGIPSMFWKSRACFIIWNVFIVVIVYFYGYVRIFYNF